MKILVLLTSLIIVYTNAYSNGVNNGGDGVYLPEKNKTYLLDLVEVNVHESPFFSDMAKYDGGVATEIARYLEIDFNVAQLISAKLLEVYEKNSLLEFLLKREIFKHDWVFVPSTLLDVKDEDSVLDFGSLQLRQLAIRKFSKITVNKEEWDERLDDKNRAALIIHEAMYALHDRFTANAHQSASARAITGMLFRQKFQQMNRNEFARLLQNNGLRYIDDIANTAGTLNENQIIVLRPDKMPANSGFYFQEIVWWSPTKIDTGDFVMHHKLGIDENDSSLKESHRDSQRDSFDKDEMEQIKSNSSPDFVIYTPSYLFLRY